MNWRGIRWALIGAMIAWLAGAGFFTVRAISDFQQAEAGLDRWRVLERRARQRFKARATISVEEMEATMPGVGPRVRLELASDKARMRARIWGLLLPGGLAVLFAGWVVAGRFCSNATD